MYKSALLGMIKSKRWQSGLTLLLERKKGGNAPLIWLRHCSWSQRNVLFKPKAKLFNSIVIIGKNISQVLLYNNVHLIFVPGLLERKWSCVGYNFMQLITTIINGRKLWLGKCQIPCHFSKSDSPTLIKKSGWIMSWECQYFIYWVLWLMAKIKIKAVKSLLLWNGNCCFEMEWSTVWVKIITFPAKTLTVSECTIWVECVVCNNCYLKRMIEISLSCPEFCLFLSSGHILQISMEWRMHWTQWNVFLFIFNWKKWEVKDSLKTL